MYLVYKSYYGKIANEGGTTTEVVGLKKNFIKAVKIANQQLKQYQDNNYITDENFNGFKEESEVNICHIFRGEQNNWSEYFELVIRKVELTE